MTQILAADGVSTLTMKQEGDQTILHKQTDVSYVVRRVEQLRQAGATKTKDGDHLAACIPIALLQEWALKKGLPGWQAVSSDDKMLDRFLAEHDKFRVYQGKI